jgi:transcriptional regulator with XRE-family HTH domain
MSYLHDQIKKRRKELGFKQDDIAHRVGMARQQYQRLESKGNPRLDTLELIAKGLKMELLLIPQEKLRGVRDILKTSSRQGSSTAKNAKEQSDPWQDLLGDS